MKHEAAVSLFQQLHPGFFDKPWIQAMDEDDWMEEMVLDLKQPLLSCRQPDGDVAFGLWDGNDLEGLRAIVNEVEEGWPKYYHQDSRVYCGFCDGQIVSFCLINDLGVREVDGRSVRVGGPGCVGTLPAYRNRGIGLKMVENVTRILADEGFDYSYIHYTGVGPWYARLGYERILQWNRHGPI